MPPDSNIIITKLGNVIQYLGYQFTNLPLAQLEEKQSLALHAIDTFAPPESIFLERAVKATSLEKREETVEALAGIVRGLQQAYIHGLLASVQELIHAEMFGDLLVMAEYLLQEGYKDAAAVTAGGVLEEHLRKLCQKHTISITTATAKGDAPKKTSLMNDELAKAVVYSKLDQKNVTAWLDLRNNAAHGKYTEYDEKHVEYMIVGLKDFVARYRA